MTKELVERPAEPLARCRDWYRKHGPSHHIRHTIQMTGVGEGWQMVCGKGTDAMTALQRAAANLADEMEGLLPYLESHHFKTGALADAVQAVRDAIREEQTND